MTEPYGVTLEELLESLPDPDEDDGWPDEDYEFVER